VPTALNLRPAVRVVLVDPADRVLMVRWRLADGRGVWGVPGGGIEPGESHADAVHRELREEVGLDLPECGPCVAHRTHVFDIRGGYDGQRSGTTWPRPCWRTATPRRRTRRRSEGPFSRMTRPRP